MANLSVRKVDEQTVAALRSRAATHGVSMEEEIRRILKSAVAEPENIADLARELFAPTYGDEPAFELPERELPRPPLDFAGNEKSKESEKE